MSLDDHRLLESHPGTDPDDFPAEITEIDGRCVRLDSTMFHASGGGQPADHGTIETERGVFSVVDVRGRGRIEHVVEEEGVRVGDRIIGRIDVERRNALSTMHTAQHLVSAHADLLWGAETVGNQIGTDRTRIDLRFPDRDAFDPARLEEAVNLSIAEDLPVTMSFRERVDLLDDPLVRVNIDRMPPAIERWRVIEIGELDRCPCAGTHVRSTGAIPTIGITKVKSKGAGKLRVEYSFG